MKLWPDPVKHFKKNDNVIDTVQSFDNVDIDIANVTIQGLCESRLGAYQWHLQ